MMHVEAIPSQNLHRSPFPDDSGFLIKTSKSPST